MKRVNGLKESLIAIVIAFIIIVGYTIVNFIIDSNKEKDFINKYKVLFEEAALKDERYIDSNSKPLNNTKDGYHYFFEKNDKGEIIYALVYNDKYVIEIDNNGNKVVNEGIKITDKLDSEGFVDSVKFKHRKLTEVVNNGNIVSFNDNEDNNEQTETPVSEPSTETTPSTGDKPSTETTPSTGNKPSTGTTPSTGNKPSTGTTPSTGDKPSSGSTTIVPSTTTPVTPSTTTPTNKKLTYQVNKYQCIHNYPSTDSNYNSHFNSFPFQYEYEKDGDYVVNLFRGQFNTGGYSIKVKEVKIDNNDNVIILYEEENPCARCYTTQAFTYPCTSVAFNKKPTSVKSMSVDRYEFENNTDQLSYTISESYQCSVDDMGYIEDITKNALLGQNIVNGDGQLTGGTNPNDGKFKYKLVVSSGKDSIHKIDGASITEDGNKVTVSIKEVLKKKYSKLQLGVRKYNKIERCSKDESVNVVTTAYASCYGIKNESYCVDIVMNKKPSELIVASEGY